MDLGLPASMDPNWMVRKIQELDRELQQLKGAASNLLIPAGIRARASEVTFEKPIVVQGSMTSTGPITSDGAMTINGAAKITGTLDLPAGIIGNDALAAPIEVGSASVQELEFGTEITDQDRAVATIPIPAGYTRALVLCVAIGGAINTGTNSDFLYVSAVVNGSASRELYTQAAPNQAAPPISTAKSAFLSGLSGGVITVATRIHSQGTAWAASPPNRAYTEAQALFLR